MIALLDGIAGAVIAELVQRYELTRMLNDIAKDARRLEDLGMSYEEIRTGLVQEQRRQSPLRAYIASRRTGQIARGDEND